MHLCYIDESGTSSIPGNTSHFVLAGVSIPVLRWSDADHDVTGVLKKYGLEREELHTTWIMRPYLEQARIANFEKMDWAARRAAVEKERTKELLRLQQVPGGHKAYQQTKKNYRHSKAYVHLSLAERKTLIAAVAATVSKWGYARLFAECIDKTHFDPVKVKKTVDEQAFEQIVSRFEQYLVKTSPNAGPKHYGLLVHDNNQTIAHKHTALMRDFQQKGTLWTTIERIVETPLFVDSSLTRLVQVADLCAYALRRYVENHEEPLFKQVYARADKIGNRVLGVRHFTNLQCNCLICQSHRAKNSKKPAAGGAKGP